MEKMRARIRTWSSTHYSYHGRLQLINTILMSLHFYSERVFTLPKKVLKEVDSICRAFLWSGEYYSRKAGYVAWPQVGLPKLLGLRNIQLWNSATMGRYAWAIAKKKETYG